MRIPRFKLLWMLPLLFISMEARAADMDVVRLPGPKIAGKMSVEEAIAKRRSVRSYSSKEITMEKISQLLWACQGITDREKDLRASPSAGGLYPLEVYLVRRDGVYHYVPQVHKLERLSDKDVKRSLAEAAYGQRYIEEADIDIVICAVYERVVSKYGERGVRYTDMEAGHAAQNVFLQAAALGLDSVPVGAFGEAAVLMVLGLGRDVKPLYILPVGYRKL